MIRARFIAVALAVMSLLPIASFAAPPAETDAKGCTDHPLLTRMPDMYIANCRTVAFDRFEFRTGPKVADREPVEGKLYEIRYTQKAGPVVPSPLQIIRNHQQAMKSVGGTTKFEDRRWTTLAVAKDGKETWVQVDTAYGRGYILTIVERQAMAQEVKADAAAFGTGLKTTGHVEVPGIYFDTGKAELKPESDAAIAEVAKLLQADAALKVYVVGHTDNTASLDLNTKLSQARADAVVQALVTKHKIAAARLVGRGAGPLAPVASNDTEDGRAKNRRVELVKQ